MQRVRHFLRARRAAPPDSQALPGEAAAAPGATAVASSLLDCTALPPDLPLCRAPYLRWLLAAPPAPRKPGSGSAARVLAAIDTELDSREGGARLLRRAPHVVPRLIEALRSDRYSTFEVAKYVEKDVVLMTEVMRVARSCLYSHYMQRRPTVAQAVDLLGSAGLNEVIARVLFRPLFNAPAGSRSFQAGQHVLDDANRCAGLAIALSADIALDPVDAHLAGLLQGAGWSALLRALEVNGALDQLHVATLDDERFAGRLFARRDRMLAQLLRAWNVSPSLNELAEALDARADDVPLHNVLGRAQDLVMLRRLQALGELPGGVAPPLEWPAVVGSVYLQ
jgi:HD-like signal output (HDOD) protein